MDVSLKNYNDMDSLLGYDNAHLCPALYKMVEMFYNILDIHRAFCYQQSNYIFDFNIDQQIFMCSHKFLHKMLNHVKFSNNFIQL